jgi:Domain of unknown function (DUF6378)
MPKNRVDEVLEERQSIYGDAETNFTKVGQIWGTLLQREAIPSWQVALLLDAYKTVRCFANPIWEDSWDDKMGYTIHGRKIAMDAQE